MSGVSGPVDGDRSPSCSALAVGSWYRRQASSSGRSCGRQDPGGGSRRPSLSVPLRIERIRPPFSDRYCSVRRRRQAKASRLPPVDRSTGSGQDVPDDHTSTKGRRVNPNGASTTAFTHAHRLPALACSRQRTRPLPHTRASRRVVDDRPPLTCFHLASSRRRDWG